MLAQHRSIRGTFSSKVKDAMNFVFERELPMINKLASPSQIQEWKGKPEVKRCHEKLFKKVNTNCPSTYMTEIIEKIWRERQNAPKIQIAFAISICETYLDPMNQVIQMNEQTMKPKIMKNLVSLNLKLYTNENIWIKLKYFFF